MGRPGRARVEVLGPRDDIEAVLVSGTAVLVLQGEIVVDGVGRSPVT
jgi:predicted PhzF superfamily epimerase YddE/YHI9